MTAKTRRQTLEEFVAAHPADSFARYGLAMECMKSGDHQLAIEHFETLLRSNAQYVPAYMQLGQLLATLQRREEARKVFSEGIRAAQHAGNAHAREEMEAFLRDLS
jgi:tetratricopeptide (TPR) repeat protein